MSKFHPIEFYRGNREAKPYQPLPFRFTALDDQRYVLSNLAGEYVVVDEDSLRDFGAGTLNRASETYEKLRSYHFLVDEYTEIAKDLLAIKVRTRYERLAEFTCLHLFVVTLRCEHSCPYCQVSRQSTDRASFDMTQEQASAALNLALRSPATNLKIEFQGGEPLLNFDLIKFIVHEAKNRAPERSIAFVVATNLAVIDDEMLGFFKDHDVYISTSLDGPQDLHNKNRPRPGADSYQRAIAGIRRVRDVLGKDRVSALMTTTEKSLSDPVGVIDEYVRQGFNEIFLRPLSPYGFAIKTKSFQRYRSDRWIEFYKKGLSHILELNRHGIPFREVYASIVLTKMLSSVDPGYVDLMSPSGIGIGAVVYNYDGDVYASDEGRMLAEMGDKTFRLGNVLTDSYDEIFLSPNLLNPIEESFAYSVPQCNDCAFEPYCGSDPVYHWATANDFVGRKPESEYCSRNMAIFRYLINEMERDVFARNLFREWVA